MPAFNCGIQTAFWLLVGGYAVALPAIHLLCRHWSAQPIPEDTVES